MQPAAFKYAAFLSYSHRDNRPDRPWADWLHGWLERFKVPPDLIGRSGRYDTPVPSRLFPIFQDGKELPTNADLAQAIDEALEQSRYLIVICSPNAAQSLYVNQEILKFKQMNRANRILAIIVAGEPNASDPRKGLDPSLECFPPALRHPVLPDGTIDPLALSEPIAADVRGPHAEERSPADAGHGPVLEREALRIAAGLLGIGFDDLVQRDKTRQLDDERARSARLRKLVGAFAVLAAVAVGAGTVALFQRAAANRERQTATRNLAESDFRQAIRLISESHKSEAVAYLARSVQADPSNHAAATRLATLLANTRWMPRVATLTHDDRVESAEFSNDGRWIVTIAGKTARVWDGVTGRTVATLQHPGVVRFAQLTAADRLMTTSDIGGARLWNLQTGVPLLELPIPATDILTGAEISPDGRFVVLGYVSPHVAAIHDITTGAKVRTMVHDGSLRHASYLSNDRIVTATATSAWIWDASTGRLIARTAQHRDVGLVTLKISADRRRLLTAGWDGNAQVFDTVDGSPVTPLMKHGQRITDAAFSTDGSLVVTGSWDRTAKIWDARTGVLLGSPLQHEGVIGRADFNNAGTLVLTGSLDGAALAMDIIAPGPATTRVWDTGARALFAEPIASSYFGRFNRAGDRLLTTWDKTALLWNVNESLPETLVARGDTFSALDISSDGRAIATASIDGSIRLWDPSRGTSFRTIENAGLVFTVLFDVSGRRLLTLSLDETNPRAHQTTVWDAATGKRLWHDRSGSTAAALDRGGRFAAVADPEGVLRVWDVDSGELKGGPFRADGAVSDVGFSRDGTQLFAASLYQSVRAWDLRSGKQVSDSSSGSEQVQTAVLSPDRSRFVSVTESHAVIRDVRTGKAAAQGLGHENRIHVAMFSPDGSYLATSSRDGTARIWDVATGRPTGEPLRHDHEVGYLTFSPDSRRLATSTVRGDVRVWDVRTGVELIEPQRHEKVVLGMRFTPDGNRLISVSRDGTLRIWDIAPASAPPAWLFDLATAISQRRLDGGTVTMVDGQPELLERLRKTLATGDDPWTIWGRWLLSDPASRSRSPFRQ